jgi:alpha-tubulin suppressor-like RCC1 family protein
MLTARRRWLGSVLCLVIGALGGGCGGGGSSGSPRGQSVASIAAGGYAGYALLADGRLWAWGDDLEGQIGTAGAWELSTVPVEVAGLPNVVSISGGANSAYALQHDGTVWAWGDDSQDELGDTGYSPKQSPRRVRVPSGIVAIQAGEFSAYALRRDGTVWAWGSDSLGQLGSAGPQVARGTPVRVGRLTGIVAIAAGAGNGYALRRDGTVWGWGDDSLGQLGPRDCTPSQVASHKGSGCPPAAAPVEVRGLSGVTAIAAGAYTVYALTRDGTVWAWGDDSFGALGRRSGGLSSAKPVRVDGLGHARAIAAGSYTAYAVLSDGSLRAWGRGADGELGNGSAANRVVPTRVLAQRDVITVAAGGAMAYALDRRGRVWAWGSGLYGQLGNGFRESVASPTAVWKLP